MTRQRQSLDQVKSPTQRMEQLKKLQVSASKSPKSNASKPSSLSPSVTPLPKRRSVSDRSSPIPASLKLLSENTGRSAAKTTVRQGTTHSRIPTRTASTATSSSSSSSSKTKSLNSKLSNVSQSAPKTRLPALRKSNRR